MSDHELFFQTVEAAYAGSIDTNLLPGALELAGRLLGGAGGTLEVIDKPARRPIGFWAGGLPQLFRNKYVEQYAPLNPRIPLTFRQSAGEVAWDYKLLDEDKISHDPFYAEFLKDLDLRYFISVVLRQTKTRLAVVTVQRTHKQGHVGEREIELMRRFAPHFERAHDMNLRLARARQQQDLLENSLDWLTDGVALLKADGRIVYTNSALRALERRGDGLRVVGGNIEFATPDMRRRFAAALGAVASARDLSSKPVSTDFVVPRADGLPAFTVSLRPLFRKETIALHHIDAAVMMLIRDPLARNGAAAEMLQELFGLTPAEAQLAQALCAGINTRVYARDRQVSITTVYTHLRRIREKTGYRSVAELVAALSELDVPLRLS